MLRLFHVEFLYVSSVRGAAFLNHPDFPGSWTCRGDSPQLNLEMPFH